MKIVVLDGYTLNPGDLSWENFKNFGDLTVYERSEEEKVEERIKDAQIVLTNKSIISKKTIKNSPSLKYIGVLATGYNVVDLEEAKQKNITITNIPQYATNSVAQFTFALLLELCNRVGHHNTKVHEGKWARSKDFTFCDYPLVELSNKTFGIVGMGRIAKATAKIAEAFNMKVIYNSRSKKNDVPYKWVDLKTLFESSDVLSLNCPLNEETKNLINKDTLNLMKKNAFIINTARGPIINEEDLYKALKENLIAGAALDVLSKEPPESSNSLFKLDNCIITPHIAWAPHETRERLMQIAENNLKSFLEGKAINTI